MSKYKTIRAEFKNPASLRKALTDLGLDVQVAGDGRVNQLNLFNRWGHGDAKVALMVSEDSLRASGRIDRTYGGMGFAWNGAGFDLVYDDLDATRSQFPALQSAIKQRYSVAEAKALAVARGYTLTESTLADGSVRLIATQY